MVGVIPPSRSTSKKLRKYNKKNKKCSTWLLMNVVCLTMNIGLLCAIFVFHANWMPSPRANLVLHSHLKNRREFWALLRGETLPPKAGNNKETAITANDIEEKDESNNNGNIKEEVAKSNIDYVLPTSPNNSPNDDATYDLNQQQYHIIFSTGCSDKQHWQSYMLFYSMITSGQKGHMTRIASGCTEEEEQDLKRIHQEQIEPMGKGRFHLHLTPEFGSGFHYNNKPYGVHHWMSAVLGYSKDQSSTDHDNTLLFLLDPDQVILRPFINDFPADREIWRKRTSYAIQTRIKHGYPMAAEYGYKNQWFTKIDVSKIVPDSPITTLHSADIDENYHGGPPYAATAKDFYKIVTQWKAFAQPVHEQYPYLLSEMFAYSLAAAHLKLPHQLAQTFMVSDWKEPGLNLVTKGDLGASHMCRRVPTEFKPHVLHYCQRLALGKYMMTKHRLPQSFVGKPESCAMPLLMEPPEDAAVQFDYFVDVNTGKRYDIRDQPNGAFSKQQKIDEAAFLLCELLRAFNLGATYYKEHHCPEDQRNLENTFIFFDTIELTAAEQHQDGEII